jgi:hypothetical protein
MGDITNTRTRKMTMTDKKMRITGGKGFHLDLPNSVTVSVQWGPGNYSDSECRDADFDAPKKAEAWGSDLAECAAYVTGTNLSWVSVPGLTGPRNKRDDAFYDNVAGYLNVEQVLDFINRASNLHDHKSLGDPVEDPTPSDQYPFPLPGQ